MISIEFLNVLQHAQCCLHRANCILLRVVGDWDSEHRHQSVADEFIEEALFLFDDPRHHSEIFIQPAQDFSGILSGGEFREAPNIGEQNRRCLLWPAITISVRRSQISLATSSDT